LATIRSPIMEKLYDSYIKKILKKDFIATLTQYRNYIHSHFRVVFLNQLASYRTDGSKKYPFCVGYKQNQNITSVQ